jgi:glycerol-3-phosphate dehydrogenase
VDYDLVVIGGGITGAGVARDAALRGLRVCLFEKGDFAAGTSSKSSKLIHGGLRYLEHGEIGLVFESVSERKVQTRLAPHLVRAMPFVVPIYDDTKPGLEVMNLGLWIYDSLALFQAPRMHKTFRGKQSAIDLEPALRTEGLRGAIEYFDCQTDDARLTLENILDAQAMGARCHSYTAVVGLDRDPTGRVHAVRARDLLGGADLSVTCRMAIVAAGPWTDAISQRLDLSIPTVLRPTKGVHIVVPHDRLPIRSAVTLFSSIDGRVFFAIPWRGRTVIGTTDTDFHGDPDDVIADASDVEYLCTSANAYFSRARITADDVIATWAGLRPLIRAEGSESEVSREHQLFVRDDGVLLVAGGKLTTYRRMGKEVVTAAVKWLKQHDPSFEHTEHERAGTKHRPLPGTVGLPSPDLDGISKLAAALVQQLGVPEAAAAHLAGIYGGRATTLASMIAATPALGATIDPELPYLWAEVTFAVTVDEARTVSDVLARRVPLLLVSRDQGLGVCPQVAATMAKLLSWDAATEAAQVAAYQAEVASTRRFRSSPR